MSKIVRLTESDLMRLVRKVLIEQSNSQINIGDVISGMANAHGNRPLDVDFKITNKGTKGLEGVLTKWGFSSEWGTKVGDKIILKNMKGSLDGNGVCTIEIPNSKIGQVNVEYCEKIPSVVSK